MKPYHLPLLALAWLVAACSPTPTAVVPATAEAPVRQPAAESQPEPEPATTEIVKQTPEPAPAPPAPRKAPDWQEYEADFLCLEGHQPSVTIKWYAMGIGGIFREYPSPWREGMRFGHGDRFEVVLLRGTDHDGKRKSGEEVTLRIRDTVTERVFQFRTGGKTHHRSYSDEWIEKWRRENATEAE